MRSVTELLRTVTRSGRQRPGTPSARENRRSRAALAAVVAGCVGVTGVAVAGAGNASPGMKFSQPGRYIYNSTVGKIFHVNGATKNVDQEIPLPGAGPGTQVVESDQNGYVLSRGRTYQFGKSSLDVENPLPAPVDELPVVLEAGGSAFAVYRNSGQIIRFGEKVATAKVGAPIASPVVTSDGTVWVHRPDNGQLCLLPLDADRLACPAELPSGHTGALAVVGANQVVFVDTTGRELYAVDDGGLGRKVMLPIADLPRDAIVASNDVTGRLAIVDREKSVLHLVDAAGLTSGKADAPPVSKQLRKGRYERIVSSGNSLALIDESTDTLVTLDRNGDERATRKIPAPSKDSKAGPEDKTGLYRGGDSRLYVASRSGEQVMVVEETGDVTAVDTTTSRPDQRKTPQPVKPSAKPSTPDRPVQPPPTTRPPQPPSTGEPKPPADRPTSRPGDDKTQPPDKPADRPSDRPADRPTDPPSTDRPKPPPEKPTPPAKPTVQASRPGAPRSVSGKPGNASVQVSWEAAAANGAPVTSYTLSWNGGSVRLGPGARSRNVTGLTNGTGYTFTVRATNRVGTGPGSSTGRLVPSGGAPDAPGNFQVTTSGSSLSLSWSRPDLKGNTLQGYDFAANPTAGTGTAKADSTSGTRATLTGLTSGATYRVTVRATTTDAQGNFVLGRQAVRTIVVGGGSSTQGKLTASRGASTTHGDGDRACEAPGCAYILVRGTGLKPNTEYFFQPFTTQWQPSNPGATLRTDENGAITIDDRFATDAPGQQVWVVASAPGEDDVTSNKFTWRS